MQEATKDESAAKLAQIQNDIAAAAKLAARKASEIQLIAVSKTRAADDIRPLLDVGQRHFGENRVQEAASKWPDLRRDYPAVQLHLIGQLQSNKADEAVALFDYIHSLDRMSLVSALGKAMAAQDKLVACFIQVNIGNEAQKGGCAIAEVTELVTAAKAAGIPVAGLMCLPPEAVEPAPYFALLAKMAKQLELPQLSMGMSGDFPTAIMLGATYVRVGTALFGARQN